MEILASKKFKIAAMVVGLLILMFASFASGIFVGLKKARFSYSWGENYERNFMGGPHGGPDFGPGMGMMRQFEGRDFRNGHGLAGTIVSITGNNIIIKDRDSKENTIAVSDKTLIKNGPNDVKLSDLKSGERIVVVGRPGDGGAVEADLIRVFSNDGPTGNRNNAQAPSASIDQNDNPVNQ